MANQKIEPIEKKNVAELVFQKMLNMIIEGTWKQGEMIPSENALREAFSVSRDTVRQAVHRLSALGILRSRQGKGTYVEQIDTSFYFNMLVPSLFLTGGDSISILEFEKCIQAESVRIVCKRASDEEIDVLQTYLDKMGKTKDYDEYFEYDMGYHCYLSQLTGNSLFIKSMEIIQKLLHVYLRDIVAFHGSEKSLQQHEECYRRIRERDAEGAVQVMVEHCDMLLERMQNWLSHSEEDNNRRKGGEL